MATTQLGHVADWWGLAVPFLLEDLEGSSPLHCDTLLYGVTNKDDRSLAHGYRLMAHGYRLNCIKRKKELRKVPGFEFMRRCRRIYIHVFFTRFENARISAQDGVVNSNQQLRNYQSKELKEEVKESYS